MLQGFGYGFGQFGTQAFLASLFFAGGLLMKYVPGMDGGRIFVCIWVVLMGAYSASSANNNTPDMPKGKKAAVRIFRIIDAPTKINAVDSVKISESQSLDKSLTSKKLMAIQRTQSGQFKGKIEFRDVWFRYPSRPDQWVLKDFKLTIQPCDSIAIVGESGQGKSTLINLIMRFYDPDFGQILIDDIDVTDWNINELRMNMGLVM